MVNVRHEYDDDDVIDRIRVNAVCPGDTFVKRWTTSGYFSNILEPVASTEALAPTEVPLRRYVRNAANRFHIIATVTRVK